MTLDKITTTMKASMMARYVVLTVCFVYLLSSWCLCVCSTSAIRNMRSAAPGMISLYLLSSSEGGRGPEYDVRCASTLDIVSISVSRIKDIRTYIAPIVIDVFYIVFPLFIQWIGTYAKEEGEAFDKVFHDV